jgi:hypothetical protein
MMSAIGDAVLRGKSGIFVTPVGVGLLRDRIAETDSNLDLHALAPIPLGLPNLPVPDRMTLPEWRGLASGAIYPEKRVENYIAQPLLRLALAAVGSTHLVKPQFAIGRKRVDFAIVDGERPTAVVEVKVKVRVPVGSNWQASPDFLQVVEYARRLGVPGLLVDVNNVYVVSPERTSVSQVFDRRSISE